MAPRAKTALLVAVAATCFSQSTAGASDDDYEWGKFAWENGDFVQANVLLSRYRTGTDAARASEVDYMDRNVVVPVARNAREGQHLAVMAGQADGRRRSDSRTSANGMANVRERWVAARTTGSARQGRADQGAGRQPACEAQPVAVVVV